MKRLPVVLPAAGCLVAVTAWGVVTLSAIGSHRSVYSVAEARSALMQAPKRWVQRSILVHGRLDGCPAAPVRCLMWQPRLFDLARAHALKTLPVEWSADARWVVLQKVPLLSHLFLSSDLPRWGAAGLFWVRVRALPTAHCATGTCDTGTHDDAFACDASACYEALVSSAGP
jgi:hypothetical protein